MAVAGNGNVVPTGLGSGVGSAANTNSDTQAIAGMNMPYTAEPGPMTSMGQPSSAGKGGGETSPSQEVRSFADGGPVDEGFGVRPQTSNQPGQNPYATSQPQSQNEAQRFQPYTGTAYGYNLNRLASKLDPSATLPPAQQTSNTQASGQVTPPPPAPADEGGVQMQLPKEFTDFFGSFKEFMEGQKAAKEQPPSSSNDDVLQRLVELLENRGGSGGSGGIGDLTGGEDNPFTSTRPGSGGSGRGSGDSGEMEDTGEQGGARGAEPDTSLELDLGADELKDKGETVDAAIPGLVTKSEAAAKAETAGLTKPLAKGSSFNSINQRYGGMLGNVITSVDDKGNVTITSNADKKLKTTLPPGSYYDEDSKTFRKANGDRLNVGSQFLTAGAAAGLSKGLQFGDSVKDAQEMYGKVINVTSKAKIDSNGNLILAGGTKIPAGSSVRGGVFYDRNGQVVPIKAKDKLTNAQLEDIKSEEQEEADRLADKAAQDAAEKARLEEEELIRSAGKVAEDYEYGSYRPTEEAQFTKLKTRGNIESHFQEFIDTAKADQRQAAAELAAARKAKDVDAIAAAQAKLDEAQERQATIEKDRDETLSRVTDKGYRTKQEAQVDIDTEARADFDRRLSGKTTQFKAPTKYSDKEYDKSLTVQQDELTAAKDALKDLKKAKASPEAIAQAQAIVDAQEADITTAKQYKTDHVATEAFNKAIKAAKFTDYKAPKKYDEKEFNKIVAEQKGEVDAAKSALDSLKSAGASQAAIARAQAVYDAKNAQYQKAKDDSQAGKTAAAEAARKKAEEDAKKDAEKKKPADKPKKAEDKPKAESKPASKAAATAAAAKPAASGGSKGGGKGKGKASGGIIHSGMTDRLRKMLGK